jgi:hypothetical protein
MTSNTNSFPRLAAGVSLLLAPVALLLAMIIDPPSQGGVHGEGLAYATNPVAASISATLLHYCWVLFVPGVLGMLQLVRGRGVVLANVASVPAVLGLINMSALMLVDFFEIGAYQQLPPDQAAAVLDKSYLPAVIFGWQLPAMIGSLLGLVLAGVAVARAGKAGWWLPGGTVAGLALFVVGAQSGMLMLGVAGPVVLVITFGAMGLILLRTNDEEKRISRPIGQEILG